MYWDQDQHPVRALQDLQIFVCFALGIFYKYKQLIHDKLLTSPGFYNKQQRPYL